MIRLYTCFALCGVLTAACGIDGAPRPPKAVAAERQAEKQSDQVDDAVDEGTEEDLEEPTDDV